MRLLARRVSAFICGSCADRVVCRRYGADSASADHHRCKKQDRISAGFRVEFFHFYCCRSEVSFQKSSSSAACSFIHGDADQSLSHKRIYDK